MLQRRRIKQSRRKIDFSKAKVCDEVDIFWCRTSRNVGDLLKSGIEENEEDESLEDDQH